MNPNIPPSYEAGVRLLEEMPLLDMCKWLESEVREESHLLAGQAEDFPVQAIVNHQPYLTLDAQKRLAMAIDALISAWRSGPGTWTDSAVRALFNLAAELRVGESKAKLQTWAAHKNTFQKIKPALRAPLLRTIATLSGAPDRRFWNELPEKFPEFAGIAFQVLARIAPEDALVLLRLLPTDDSALNSVARKLPDFVSQFPATEKNTVLARIGAALRSMPAKKAKPLQSALTEAGFNIPSSLNSDSWQVERVKMTLGVFGHLPKLSSVFLGAPNRPADACVRV